MLNKVTLIGNLGKDPEVRKLNDGKQVASFSVATSESYKDKTTGEKKTITEWHHISCWGNLADIAGRYLAKGAKVYLEGKLRTRSYEDAANVKRFVTEIIAHELVMLGTKSEARPAPIESSGHPVLSTTNETTSDTSTDDLPF